MNFDLVHDIQQSYRKLLNVMSRPGEIENISDLSEKLDIDIEVYKSNYLIMLMLLDGEVSFNVYSENREKINKIVGQITNSKLKPFHEADYLFVTKEAKNITDVMSICKVGDLSNPHKSATLIIEVENLDNNKELKLTGPGIKDSNYLSFESNKEWLKIRNEKNKEYPLGIDIILIDEKGNLACLPRTTKVQEV